MTDVYTAIMRAADHIERNPECNDYGCPIIGDGFSVDKGCALAWVGYFAGMKLPWAKQVATQILGCRNENQALDRLTKLVPDWNRVRNDVSQASCAPRAAKALRLYAAKYHAPAKPDTGFRDFMAKALPVSDHVREWREMAIDIIKTPREP